MNEGQNWFVRRGGEIRGPFPAGLVSRYVLLGRVRLSDEVSPDSQAWRPVRQVPELIPEVMLDAARNADDMEAQQRLAAARRWAREGAGADESHHGRHGTESRKPVQYTVVIAVVAAIALIPFVLPSGPDLGEPDCDAAAAPGVNWSNCVLENRDLANANLEGATLRNAELSGVVLRAASLRRADFAYAELEFAAMTAANLEGAMGKGTSLRGVDLTNANLRNADLTYADLTGADLSGAVLEGVKLGYAVWGEGILCMPESVGRCIPGRPVD